jgi:hypothetical protein
MACLASTKIRLHVHFGRPIRASVKSGFVEEINLAGSLVEQLFPNLQQPQNIALGVKVPMPAATGARRAVAAAGHLPEQDQEENEVQLQGEQTVAGVQMVRVMKQEQVYVVREMRDGAWVLPVQATVALHGSLC